MLDIVITVILLAISFALLGKGANFLVKGSSDIARFLKVSPMIIGLTIVAFGTSLPEFIVSLISAISGLPDIAMGNIIGSNIANIGLIMGISAMLMPLAIKTKTLTHELPFMVIATFLFVILANNKYLFQKDTLSFGWIDGIIFIAIFAFFFYYIFRSIRKTEEVEKEFAAEVTHRRALWKNNLMIIGGIAMLIGGGRLFIVVSEQFIQLLGLSASFIGLFIAAIGTSLPELFTSVIAAWHKHPSIAIGNIIGSSIFNILGIVGFVSLFTNIIVNPTLLFVDAFIMIAFTVTFFIMATSSDNLSRKEGIILFLGYGAYLGYLYTLI